MDKRVWNLFKEVRRLRRKVKVLESELARSNQNYNALWYKKSQEVDYNTLSIMIPNMYAVEKMVGPFDPYSRPKAEYITKRLSMEEKAKLIDNLFEQGYIQHEDSELGERFTIKVIK